MNCSKEMFSGISRAQLLKELKAERDVLTACVANGLPLVRAHFASELRAVVGFIEYLTATPPNAPQTATNRPSCAFHTVIRRTFAIAREHGLDTRADEAMRGAIGRALGFTIASRDELNGLQWAQVGDKIKSGALCW